MFDVSSMFIAPPPAPAMFKTGMFIPDMAGLLFCATDKGVSELIAKMHNANFRTLKSSAAHSTCV